MAAKKDDKKENKKSAEKIEKEDKKSPVKNEKEDKKPVVKTEKDDKKSVASTENEAIHKDSLAIPGSMLDDLAIATDFLVTSKAAVRNLAVAITETATPSVKKILRRELDIAIDTHDKIAQYMIKKEMYHAYDIEEQVEHDLKKADIALELAKKK